MTTDLKPSALAETRNAARPIAEAREAGNRILRAIVVLGEDFAYCVLLWGALYGFEKLTHWLPVKRWGELIEDIHALGSAAVICLLSILLVLDFVRIKVRR